MLVTLSRTIILYTIVLFVMRIMGKRQIGQMQPFELAISIMIADLASVPMTETGIPLTNGIISILGLLMMHLVITFLNLKSLKIREFICGKPSILIYRGKIDEKKLKKERFTINELEEKLRSNNVSSFADVEYAILETSGDISIILKPDKRNTIVSDFGLNAEYQGITYDLVLDGKVLSENLKKIGRDERWLDNELKKLKVKSEEVLVATIDGKGEIFCQKKGDGNS